MTNLSEKFEQIEVQADALISKEDRKFCETQQQNYERSCATLYQIEKLISTLEEENQLIFFPEVDEFVRSPYICLASNQIRAKLNETHAAFIRYIVKYFATHYHVEFDKDVMQKTLLPLKPSRHDCENKSVKPLTLRYQDIVEKIFVQLGGYSLQDKAVKELQNAARNGAWKANGLKLYKQKKAVVTICDCYYDYFYEKFKLYNAAKDVITALWYFECRRFDVKESPFSPLLEGSFYQSVLDFEMEKVKQIKFFKNGRVDIRFANETYARQFAEEYLGTESPYI